MRSLMDEYLVDAGTSKDGESQIKCNVCQFAFDGNAAVADHLKLHVNDPLHINGLYNCCGSSEMSLHDAIQHVLFVHPQSHLLKERIDEAGNQIMDPSPPQQKRGRLKVCHICDKEFRRPADLVRHMRVHTGERPFKCPKCDEDFKLKGHLDRHIASHNTRIKPKFCCAVCKKLFYSSTALRLHFRVHNDYRPFKCDHPKCKETFRTKKLMQSHFARDHTGRVIKQKICEAARIQLFEIVRSKPRARAASASASTSAEYVFEPIKMSNLVLSKNSAFSPINPPPTVINEKPPIVTGQVVIRIQLRSVSVGFEHSKLRSQAEIIVSVDSMRSHAAKEWLLSTQFRLGGVPMTLFLIIDPNLSLERLRESPETGFMMAVTPAVGDPLTTRGQTPLLFVISPEEAAWGQLPSLFIECFVTQPDATLENRQQFAQSVIF